MPDNVRCSDKKQSIFLPAAAPPLLGGGGVDGGTVSIEGASCLFAWFCPTSELGDQDK